MESINKNNDFFIPPPLEPYKPKLAKQTSTEKKAILQELDDAEAKLKATENRCDKIWNDSK